MRKNVVLILIILVWVISPSLKADSVMERLINKDWREVNSRSKSVYTDTIVCYTGTQRMEVCLLRNNNVRVKMQEYYLSDTMVQVFDAAEVGKHRNGKYIVFREIKGSGKKTHCARITGLSDFTHEFIMVNGDSTQSKKFVTGFKNLKLKSGEILSRDSLLSKTWCEVDLKTRQAKNSQEVFMENVVLKSTFTGDRSTVAPLWGVSEYCFSDTIVENYNINLKPEFTYGKYLVINEMGEKYRKKPVSYIISKLNKDTLELQCVSHTERDKRLFLQNKYAESVAQDTTVKRSVMNSIIGRHWYFMDKGKVTDFVYITRKHIISSEIRYVKHIGWVVGESTGEYYLAKNTKGKFDKSKVGKVENGTHIRYKSLAYTKEEEMFQDWKVHILSPRAVMFSFSRLFQETYLSE